MPIPNDEDEMYHLVIEYTSGEKEFTDTSMEYTGLKKLELSFEQCIGWLFIFRNFGAGDTYQGLFGNDN